MIRDLLIVYGLIESYRASADDCDTEYYIFGKVEYRYGILQIQNPIVEKYDPDEHDI